MLLTFETSQDDRSWLKDVAPRNISYMVVTFETSQDDRSWLKDFAT